MKVLLVLKPDDKFLRSFIVLLFLIFKKIALVSHPQAGEPLGALNLKVFGS